MFVHYSAIFIQRNWRGHKIRAVFLPIILNRRNSIVRIKALVKGWKTRQIMKTKLIRNHKIGIRDASALRIDLMKSRDNTSSLLFNQISSQLPILIMKFLQDYRSLY